MPRAGDGAVLVRAFIEGASLVRTGRAYRIHLAPLPQQHGWNTRCIDARQLAFLQVSRVQNCYKVIGAAFERNVIDADAFGKHQVASQVR